MTRCESRRRHSYGGWITCSRCAHWVCVWRPAASGERPPHSQATEWLCHSGWRSRCALWKLWHCGTTWTPSELFWARTYTSVHTEFPGVCFHPRWDDKDALYSFIELQQHSESSVRLKHKEKPLHLFHGCLKRTLDVDLLSVTAPLWCHCTKIFTLFF